MAMKREHATVGLRIHPGLHRDLKRLAHRRETSMNAVCEGVLSQEVWRAVGVGELESAETKEAE